MKKTIYLIFLFVIFLSSELHSKPVEVQAIVSTALLPVKSDVMDDPAIWVNKKNPSKSLILTTNKDSGNGGLYVYTLEGQLKKMIPVGPLNNVDYRTGFSYKTHEVDIVVASHPQKKKLSFFAMNPQLDTLTFVGFSTNSFQEAPYGLCLLKKDMNFYAIVTFKGGGAEKWQFWEKEGKFHMKKVTTYPVKTQAEGCTANDLSGKVFIAEEDKGIWAFNEDGSFEIVANVGENELAADLEGLTLYDGKYLIVSSQGNSTYGVFSSEKPYDYLGNFKITASLTQEGTEETDGIDVTSANLGGNFSKGLFVAHDNRTSKGGGSNFKLVPLESIAKKLELN
ncbi:MAG: phytase [Proteobacteria bacterium]|nr:phytase [Pseudomonadota bacterium]